MKAYKITEEQAAKLLGYLQELRDSGMRHYDPSRHSAGEYGYYEFEEPYNAAKELVAKTICNGKNLIKGETDESPSD